MMQTKHYCITPSQLDAFQSYLDSDIDYEEYWGRSENPSKTVAEYQAECEKKLIDQINRCPKGLIEVADKGTAINEIVDCLILNHKPQNGVSAKSVKMDNAAFVVGVLNGFIWLFDQRFLHSLYLYFQGALTQYRCEATLETSLGSVTLYGYPDYWKGNKVYDLKTTSRYQFGKYGRKWQKHVYPFCLVESGDCTEISEFEYTVVKLSAESKSAPIISGEIYPEVYTYNHENSRQRLINICEQLILWLESRREFITDRRIFGRENSEGYVGEPIEMAQLLPPIAHSAF